MSNGPRHELNPPVLSKAEFAPLLASVSRSFFLSLRFLPEPLRQPLGLAYLLARTSDTIADASGAPLEKRLRALDRFNEALTHEAAAPHPGASPWDSSLAGLECDHPAEQHLLQKSAAILQCYRLLRAPVRAEILAVLKTIIEGQRGDLIRFGYASQEAPQALPRTADTEAYTYAVAGCVGEFWTRLCALETPHFSILPVGTLLESGRKFGQGLQLVNILRDLPADLAAGRCYLPLEELDSENLKPLDLLAHPLKARPIMERWLQKAEAWLAAGEDYVQGIQGRSLRFSVALPRLLGQETLALLRRHPPLETRTRLRVTRATVLRCAWSALRE